jgi:hypothetical protein
MSTLIQFRRDTAANWASVNPVLAQGEMGINLTTMQFKIGDGLTAWNALVYAPLTVMQAWGTITGSLSSQTDLWTELQSLEPRFNGIVNASDIAITYSAATQTITLTCVPGAGAWVAQNFFPIATQTIAHPNMTGLYYIYVNSAGVLTVSSVVWNLQTAAPVCVVYFNASGPQGVVLYELHPAGPLGMDNTAHAYLHATRGTQVLSGGFAVSGYVLATAGAAALSYVVGGGTLVDEDLSVVLPGIPKLGPYRVMWRSGTNGDWTWVDTSTTGIVDDGANIEWNQFTGGAWSAAGIATANTFVNYWIFAVPLVPGSGISTIAVMGQATYSSLSQAQAAMPYTELTGLQNFTSEGAFVARLTYQQVPGSIPSNAQLVAVSAITGNLVTQGINPTASAFWGGISGNIASQVDLQTEFATKQAVISATANALVLNSGGTLLGNAQYTVNNGSATGAEIVLTTPNSAYQVYLNVDSALGGGEAQLFTSAPTLQLYANSSLAVSIASSLKVNVFQSLTVQGAGSPPALSNVRLNAYDTQNSYLQNNVQNLSNGTGASSDWIATCDVGTDTAGYVDLGVNSSTYSQPGSWTINGAQDAYLYAQTGTIGFAIGTALAIPLIFFTGGTLASNEAMRLSAAGLVGVNQAAPAAQIDVVSGFATRVAQKTTGAALQTAHLSEWWANGGSSALAYVDVSGNIWSTANVVGNKLGANNVAPTSFLDVQTAGTTTVTAALRLTTGQTADALEVLSGAAVLTRITATGLLGVGSTVPTSPFVATYAPAAASSGTTYGGIQLYPTYANSGTAADTDLLINRTETSLGSGTHKFVDLQVAGTSKLTIDDTGTLNWAATGKLAATTTLTLQTNGAAGITVSAAQLVGIGSGATVPGARLDLVASTTTEIMFRQKLLASATGAAIQTLNSASTTIFQVDQLGNATATSIGGLATTALGLIGTLTTTAAYAIAGTSASRAITAGTGGYMSLTSTFAPASGTGVYNSLAILPTISQTGGANGTVTDLLINRTETAVVGSQYFIQGQVAGTSKFTVDHSGNIIGTSVGASTGLTLSLYGSAATNFVGTYVQASGSSGGALNATAGLQASFGVATTFAPASGNAPFNLLYLTPTINQTGGANGACIDILINRSELATVGPQYFASWQVGGTPKFSVDHFGNVIGASFSQSGTNTSSFTGPIQLANFTNAARVALVSPGAGTKVWCTDNPGPGAGNGAPGEWTYNGTSWVYGKATTIALNIYNTWSIAGSGFWIPISGGDYTNTSSNTQNAMATPVSGPCIISNPTISIANAITATWTITATLYRAAAATPTTWASTGVTVSLTNAGPTSFTNTASPSYTCAQGDLLVWQVNSTGTGQNPYLMGLSFQMNMS